MKGEESKVDWLNMAPGFVFALMQHRRYASRLRKKMFWGSDDAALHLEATQMTRDILGAFPGEPTFDHDNPDCDSELVAAEMSGVSHQFAEDLRETESYACGLAIAGIYHLWERDTKKLLAALEKGKHLKIKKADFGTLCNFVLPDTGFDLLASPQYGMLQVTCLIANTIKHGEGPSAQDLLALRPDLFIQGKKAADLRVGLLHFDESTNAIDQLWIDWEGCYSKIHRSDRKQLIAV
jgi:hypothetical protein